jgi:hypothetical protein
VKENAKRPLPPELSFQNDIARAKELPRDEMLVWTRDHLEQYSKLSED